ncbi:hypothetical protein TG4357_01893 [Thalassovita gelatinovora]|uniref:Uncharacterized protein n=2 Tax=Thalassovita gelatinovora TaxID=53501 RepID=A0A0N7LV72_THAGE|nr:hypothetical protein TG4357_01893 [Thalassovita gelatinovora]SER08817.1 hypothetical protein SAMN04488043_11557 [Thalassovita gelatinovora]
MRFALLLARPLLVLALVLLGTVPDGMMRHAGPDGIRLVLCTSSGTKEVWLTEDGSTIPVGEKQDQGGDPHAPHCVQVSLTTQNAAPPLAEPVAFALGFCDLALPTDQILNRQTAGGATRARAPPVPV